MLLKEKGKREKVEMVRLLFSLQSLASNL